MKCKLCGINDLDNTGAHCITESLVRSAVSDDSKSGRDNEIMYSFSLSTIGNNFIGRNINEDQIKEIKGRVLTDVELESNENMMVDFELVCRSCENKFNPVETYFINKIFKNKIEKKIDEKQIELTKFDYKITLLFLLINMWRTSASNKPDFKIDDEYEEKLRRLIDNITANKINDIINDFNFKCGVISKIKFATYYFIQTTGKKSENLITLRSNTNPLVLILNQLVFLVFFDYPIKFKKDPILANITSKNRIAKLIKSQPESLKLCYISNENRKLSLVRIVKSQVKALIEQVENVIREVHLEMYGFEAHGDIIKFSKIEISKLRQDELTQYSINKIIAINLLKCGDYYKQFGKPN